MKLIKATTQGDIVSCMLIRTIVFMHEQHVDPLLEIDEDDKHCEHYLVKYKDKEGNEQVAVSFGSLMLMRSWFERYEEYQKEVKKCEKIKDVSERGLALIKAEEAFNLWMDIYPESERWPEALKAQKSHDQFMDYIGLNPKNEY